MPRKRYAVWYTWKRQDGATHTNLYDHYYFKISAKNVVKNLQTPGSDYLTTEWYVVQTDKEGNETIL